MSASTWSRCCSIRCSHRPTSSAEQRRYQQRHGIGERTIRGYLQRYRQRGPRALLFYRPRPTSPRVHDPALRAKLLKLIDEVPTRSVPQLRKLITADDKLGARIARISDRTLYRFLADHGLTKRARYLMLADDGRTSFRAFEAPHALALVQADARDGIWLDTPGRPQEDPTCSCGSTTSPARSCSASTTSTRSCPRCSTASATACCSYGIPIRVYMSTTARFTCPATLLAILVELRVKRVRHPPYQAYCKGKIEAANKIIKNQFQREAQVAGMRTIDELNSAFWAWMELEYNTRVLSATGQSPDVRFRDGLPPEHPRITDLDSFNALFLWRARRIVSKYGRIKLHGNQYPVTGVAHGTAVEVRFDPYDLATLAIHDDAGVLIETTSASRQVSTQVPDVPAESAAKPAQVSNAARAYFTRLREQHHAALRDRTQTSFTRFQSTDDDHDDNKEHRDADA